MSIEWYMTSKRSYCYPPISRRACTRYPPVIAGMVLLGLLLACTQAQARAAMAAATTIALQAPVGHSELGLPMGNGMQGGLLWGSGSRVELSLDRADLWDTRTPAIYERKGWTYTTLVSLVRKGNITRTHQLFDTPYTAFVYPTKLGAGRLELVFPSGVNLESFTLDERTGLARATLGTTRVQAFFPATQHVGLLQVEGAVPKLVLHDPSGVSRLGYPPARHGAARDGSIQLAWMQQATTQGMRYAVVVASEQHADTTTMAIAIERSTAQDDDPVVRGEQRAESALRTGFQTLLAENEAWWRHFQSISSVHVPDAAIQREYDLARYFYGAGSRADSPPLTLQGVWTADDGRLPPWKGDYHNDLNTEMTYLAAPEAGLFDANRSFLRFNWNLLPQYRHFARTFYGVPGAVVPGVESLIGRPLGGWAQYAFSPVMGAWVAQSFYQQWRYTMDRRFLHDRAYPFMAEIGTALRALMHTWRDGKLHLPLSSSPELYDDSLQAWLPPSSNFDVALERALFGELQKMASTLGDPTAARHWADVLAQLPELDVEHGILTVAPGIPLPFSHRHLSHLIAIYPLALLDPRASKRVATVANASVDDFIAKGSSHWEGYTLAWLACTLAYLDRGDDAQHWLDEFARDYVSPNGFHVNGYHGGPFTLEGNMLVMQAVQEMLLQSEHDTVRIFPAVPHDWRDASFHRLRARGGFIVSGQFRDGQTQSMSVTATVAADLHLQDPFHGQPARWNLDVRRTNGDILVHLRPGETLSGISGLSNQ